MLRSFRLVGVVVFALLMGFSSHALWKMYESGSLFDRYNSARKARITLCGLSLLALGALGYLEISSSRRRAMRRSYGGRHYRERAPSEEKPADATNIYASHESHDAWQGRRTHSRTARRHEPVEMAEVWMGLLKVCVAAIPLYYVVQLLWQWLHSTSGEPMPPIAVGGCCAVVAWSLFTAIAIYRRLRRALVLGYALAICNLLVFPVGTVMGLFLLMGLVGSTPLFFTAAKARRSVVRDPAALV